MSLPKNMSIITNDNKLDLRLYWIVDLIESSWAKGEDRMKYPQDKSYV